MNYISLNCWQNGRVGPQKRISVFIQVTILTWRCKGFWRIYCIGASYFWSYARLRKWGSSVFSKYLSKITWKSRCNKVWLIVLNMWLVCELSAVNNIPLWIHSSLLTSQNTEFENLIVNTVSRNPPPYVELEFSGSILESSEYNVGPICTAQYKEYFQQLKLLVAEK